jgi:Helitron helicase-like domain at N-terminus
LKTTIRQTRLTLVVLVILCDGYYRVAELENCQQEPSNRDQRIAAGIAFEDACLSICHSHCHCCHRVSLRLKVNKKQICSDCMALKDPNYYLSHRLLPVWYKDDIPQFHVPLELTRLTLAEKMLIQLASPFIPLRHIKNGAFGLSGHVCCFEQDVEGFVTNLPRGKSDITMLNVLKSVRTEIGSDTTGREVYKIRKRCVAEALVWLKRYNREYSDINIDMSALDWLHGPEGSLEVLNVVSHEDLCTQEDECQDPNADMGPIPTITEGILRSGDHVKTFGYIDDSPGSVISPEDREIHNTILRSIEDSPDKRDIHVQWPSHGPVAISEYSPTRIFARAFPWLFPGGFGDVKDYPGDINKWGQYLLYYEDGRFATDKFFSFFALNYITRNRNGNSGNWFVNGFNKGGPQNLQQLKESIERGDKSFVNRLTYFNKRVKGSSAYWFQQRAQVYSWINHHVEAGHGPPTFFITLSCGEYYWPDIIRLLKQRMETAKDPRVSECFAGSTKLTQIINDYSIVIQEFFQERLELWLKEVGKPVFGIAHHWGRYEFAPGRGQIHVHLLAIRKDQTILHLCHKDLQEPNGKTKRAERLAKWSSDHFGLTATVKDGFDQRQTSPNSSPCSIRLSDVVKTDPTLHSTEEDEQNLLKFCQVHECNGFCMRRSKSNK